MKKLSHQAIFAALLIFGTLTNTVSAMMYSPYMANNMFGQQQQRPQQRLNPMMQQMMYGMMNQQPGFGIRNMNQLSTSQYATYELMNWMMTGQEQSLKNALNYFVQSFSSYFRNSWWAYPIAYTVLTRLSKVGFPKFMKLMTTSNNSS